VSGTDGQRNDLEGGGVVKVRYGRVRWDVLGSLCVCFIYSGFVVGDVSQGVRYFGLRMDAYVSC
jgi:hypothetical protein